MTQLEVLERITGVLEKAGIAYMICGSVASGIYGRPRSTYHLDLVIDPTEGQLREFIQMVEEGAYVNREAAVQALRTRSMFNVIDHETGWKFDLIIRKQRPFSVEEFTRRTPEKIEGITLYFVSPEDALLSKLEWSMKSGSERQYEDALGIAIAQGAGLDMGYLEKWSSELGVRQLLERVLSEAREIL